MLPPVCLAFLLSATWAAAQTASAKKTSGPKTKPAAKPDKKAAAREELTLEKLFPKKGLWGTEAVAMTFSFDGKYAAYLYRPYPERRHGNDLWLLEMATGKLHRATSVAMLGRYQASARKVKADRETKLKAALAAEKDPKKLAVLKGKVVLDNDADQKKAPRYSGVETFTWSPTAQELLFVSEGDIYQWKVGAKEVVRLTRTRAREMDVQYLSDGKGYTCLRNRALHKVVFGSHLVEQIDPPVPQGENFYRYKLSPDGKRLVFMTYKYLPSKKPARKVGIASYRERFLRVREVLRQVSEDPPAPHEYRLYLYELSDRMVDNGKLSPIFHHQITKPGDVLSSPEWSPDSRKVAFSLYRHDTRRVQVFQAQAGSTKPAQVICKFLHTGGPFTPFMIRPFYLADNRRLALVTEQTGFRHLHVLDPLYESLEQVTFGRYEVYPVALSKDRKSFYVTATKEHPSCRDLYRLGLDDHKMERLTRGRGAYDRVIVSPDGKDALAIFRRFGAVPELVRVKTGCGCQKALTDSHPESTKKLTTVRPEFFSYQNRHGHVIHGHLFKPANWSKADKRPLFIYVYGGPLPGLRKNVMEGNYQPDAYFFARYLAEKHGYLTCTIDPRGGSGYGSVFSKANFERVGKPQVEDLEDGVKYLVTHYGADPKRVGIYGWSFGGFQAQMCLYTRPKVFAVGIAVAGPTEWENYNNGYSVITIGATRIGIPDLSKYSLLPLAKNLKGRLLLVHGMEDDNVLYQDTVRMYRALLKAGKETLVELFVDPSGSHHLGGDITPLALRRKYEDFLLRSLGKGTPAKSSPATVKKPVTTKPKEVKKDGPGKQKK
jgi:dipeptidyl aminopeptidase/acylaminoacyl peptidase